MKPEELQSIVPGLSAEDARRITDGAKKIDHDMAGRARYLLRAAGIKCFGIWHDRANIVLIEYFNDQARDLPDGMEYISEFRGHRHFGTMVVKARVLDLGGETCTPLEMPAP